AVYVLGDEHETLCFAARSKLLLEPRQRKMRCVRRSSATHTTPIQIPSPDVLRHPREGCARGQLLGEVIARADAPISFLAAERWYAALGGDTGARKHQDGTLSVPSGRQPVESNGEAVRGHSRL